MENKCCLIVLDGWGYNEAESPDIIDGVLLANPKTMRSLCNTYYSTLLYAHGTYVGLLSDNEMGNSEVGHLTLGSGRVIVQDSVRIRNTLAGDSSSIAAKLFPSDIDSVYIFGILSDGGIHGHWHNIRDIAIIASKHCKRVYVHSVSDGRDTQPEMYLTYLDAFIESVPDNVWIVSVSGRFYAMDRDKRNERTDAYFNAITTSNTNGSAENIDREKCIEGIRAHIASSYSQGVSDEFIEPVCFAGWIESTFPVIITNFRADRIRQIYSKFSQYTATYTMTRLYNDQDASRVLFERPSISDALGDIIEEKGMQQVRIAESEKQAHVTFFFDGGKDKSRKNQQIIIHPSKKVSTFDLAPEMEASLVSQSIQDSMAEGIDFILANFANCDMVGHTGLVEPAVAAVKSVDEQIHNIYTAAKKYNYNLIITADHGNAEIMKNKEGVVKSHSRNRVPLIVIQNTLFQDTLVTTGDDFVFKSSHNYSLKDVAPTILDIMQIEKPDSMTGQSLIASLHTNSDKLDEHCTK
ncbi:2,3-bisphosphoglycerate-independent phosphoglycerate mutase [Nematocida parisii]|nr:2,3-bisphosphoglycerate-independent phosphoglycerate mutase [Nematocida parisii]KAI5125725.1 2,3-bisphosphoglycerate-independent phosphoglycerate mutase [Nematocida parisii]KAI5140242.1 2,3-bisphosphoglycerate-independent phosphoglycerate mutase [Nematocida parisii]